MNTTFKDAQQKNVVNAALLLNWGVRSERTV